MNIHLKFNGNEQGKILEIYNLIRFQKQLKTCVKNLIIEVNIQIHFFHFQIYI